MAIWLNKLGAGTGIDFGNIQSCSNASSPQLTVAAWVCPTDWAGGAGAITTGTFGIPDAFMVFTAGGPQTETAGLNAPWMLLIKSSSLTTAFDYEDVQNGLNHPMTGSVAIELNQWHHLAVTYNADTGTASFFVNGEFDRYQYNTSSNPDVRLPDTGSNQRIGVGCTITSAGAKTGTFIGYISDCAFWKTDLRHDEIMLLGKSRVKGMPLQIRPQSLHLYYPLDEVPTGYTGSTTIGFYNNRAGNGFARFTGSAAGNIIGVGEPYLSYL